MSPPRWCLILNGKSAGDDALRVRQCRRHFAGTPAGAGTDRRFIGRRHLLRLVADDGVIHWCANLASGGFGTRVTVETDDGLKKMPGGLAYLITGISRLGRIEPIQARLQGPDFFWEGSFIALGIGNGSQAGGGQALCPDARIDDGLLDLTVVPELSCEVVATMGALVTEGRAADSQPGR